MSMRQRATQCLGKLPDKPRSCHPSNPTSRWPGRHYVRCGHEEQETSKLIQMSSSDPPAHASVASERIFRSRETVKAWLESSPTSVLDDLDDRESAHSSGFESFSTSPGGSDHLSYTSRFLHSSSKTEPAPHSRIRAISPPRCPANRNPADVSRIDAAYYRGGSFLMLAFKNAQYRGSPNPPAFQYTSGAFRDNHLHNLAADGYCSSPGSEFSLTSEWQYMLAAGNAAGMSTREAFANSSEFDDELDLNSGHSQLRKPSRTRSMELPRVARIHDRSASGDLKGMLVTHKKYTVQSATVRNERRQIPHGGVIHGQTALQSLPRRNSEHSTSMRKAFEQVQKQKVHSTAAAWEEAKCSKLSSRYEREKREIKSWEDQQRAKATNAMKQAELKLEVKRARLVEKMQNDVAMAHRKAEEKKAIAEAKRAEKAARAAMEAKLMRRTGKVSRGCLFLG